MIWIVPIIKLSGRIYERGAKRIVPILSHQLENKFFPKIFEEKDKDYRRF
jgi:hypothetical protein